MTLERRTPCAAEGADSTAAASGAATAGRGRGAARGRAGGLAACPAVAGTEARETLRLRGRSATFVRRVRRLGFFTARHTVEGGPATTAPGGGQLAGALAVLVQIGLGHEMRGDRRGQEQE